MPSTRDATGRPQTQYVETDQGFVAYQVIGEGERFILFCTTALKNLDAMWDEPSVVRFFDRLSSMGRVILFDMRGSGASDPVPDGGTFLSIEENVDDIRAILDEVGVEEAVVYGTAEGGFFAMMLAAVDPRRVSALILANCLPRVSRVEGYPIGFTQEEVDEWAAGYAAQHGRTGRMLNLTAPTAAADPRFMAWWTRYARMSVPMGTAKRTFEWFGSVDVRAALPLIQAPTLVIGRRDAIYHRLAFSEYLAEAIDGAELQVVEGADTLPFHAGDFGPTLDHVERFVTGGHRAGQGDRVLATVLFTDIVGSTAQVAEMGDERWLDLLAEHDRLVRNQLGRFRGTEIKMTGDGVVATFDGPARAVACAVTLHEMLPGLGLTIRAGIHTGEVEFRDGEIGGIGVHIASRVMSHADDGGVVVSGTVKDLVVGSGIEFRSCGTAQLKGVPGDWPLWEPVSP